MKIIYKTGSLLEASEPAICHGCNARGRMRSGVAKLIRERYPTAFEVYKLSHAQHAARRMPFLGSISWVAAEPHMVINAVTQQFYGRKPNSRTPDGSYVSYDAIKSCVEAINGLTISRSIDRVAFPLLGSGLARGKWSTVAEIIEATAEFQPVVYTIDGIVPA
jgi:O-acetyl-ADP-ribose deacetylase (regulator of RNase III)